MAALASLQARGELSSRHGINIQAWIELIGQQRYCLWPGGRALMGARRSGAILGLAPRASGHNRRRTVPGPAAVPASQGMGLTAHVLEGHGLRSRPRPPAWGVDGGRLETRRHIVAESRPAWGLHCGALMRAIPSELVSRQRVVSRKGSRPTSVDGLWGFAIIMCGHRHFDQVLPPQIVSSRNRFFLEGVEC